MGNRLGDPSSDESDVHCGLSSDECDDNCKPIRRKSNPIPVDSREKHRKVISSRPHFIPPVEDNIDTIDKDNLDPQETCCICLSAQPNAAVIPCGHAKFCHACLTQIVKRNPSCPVCRRKVDSVLKLHF